MLTGFLPFRHDECAPGAFAMENTQGLLVELGRFLVFDVLSLVVAGTGKHLHGGQRGHYVGAAGFSGDVRKVLSPRLGCDVHDAAGVCVCV